MAGGAILAGALTDASTRRWSILVGGLDVAKEPGTTGNGYGVDPETLNIIEEGPGGVSSATFTIDDPRKQVDIDESAPVTIWALFRDELLFRGEVDNVSSSPAFGGQGRSIVVGCTGIERELDRIKLPTAYLAGSPLPLNLNVELNKLVSSLGSPLRATMSNDPNGSFLEPIGDFGHDVAGLGEQFPYMQQAVTVPAGRSLRQAFADIIAGAGYLASPVIAAPVIYTVDFFGGLRAWLNIAGERPTDYELLTVIDSIGFAEPRAADLSRESEYGDLVRELWIVGGAADGSGRFADGSGLRGEQRVIEDASSLTRTDAERIAAAYFAGQAPARRATLTIEDYEVGDPIHAGSLVDLTDAATGATGQYRIASIDKRFNASGTENWTLSLGSFAPSSARLLGAIAREG